MRVHGRIPPSITVPRLTPDTVTKIDEICDAQPNYWLGLPNPIATGLVAELETWLTETDSWSQDARMFGSNDMHDQLSIWRDHDGNLKGINIRFSLSNPAPNNLVRLLAMPALRDCLFHGIQSESVYLPTIDNWLADMLACSASRYLRGSDYFDTTTRG